MPQKESIRSFRKFVHRQPLWDRNIKFKVYSFSVIQIPIRNRWNISQYSIWEGPSNVSSQATEVTFPNRSKKMWDALHTPSPSLLRISHARRKISLCLVNRGWGAKALINFRCWPMWTSGHHSVPPRDKSILRYTSCFHNNPILCGHGPAL